MRIRSYLVFLLMLAATAVVQSQDSLMALVTDSDASIHAIDRSPSGRLIVAVGEDNSERTRKLQMTDEHHESVILISTDGGRNWSRSAGGGDSIPLDAVIVLDEMRAVVSGSIEGAGGVIMLTRDAGRSWNIAYEGGMVHDLARNGENSLWAAGYGLLHSEDGGNSWKPMEVSEGFYHAIHAISEMILLAAGEQGLLRTVDGGRSWKSVPLPVDSRGFHRIETIDDLLMISSRDGITLVSDDEGQSWRPQ